MWRIDTDGVVHLVETDMGTTNDMRCDSEGNLYVTRYGKGTIAVLSPAGQLQEEIPLQGKNPTNIAFGGPEGRTAFVTVGDRGCIEAFRTRHPGRSWILLHPDLRDD